jgi:hypothetical protein
MAFLDLRTCQGTKTGPVTTTAATPDLICAIGLVTGTVSNLRVKLEASVGVSSIINNSLVISVVRHTNPGDFGNFGSGTVVYSQTFGFCLCLTVTATTFSLCAADYLPPAPAGGQLNYALYASAAFVGTSYQGTQNLIGIAVN